MKRKVKLTHTVELVVEAVTEDEIYEFLLEHTPSEIKELVRLGCRNVEESYDEEILDGVYLDDDVQADYVIER